MERVALCQPWVRGCWCLHYYRAFIASISFFYCPDESDNILAWWSVGEKGGENWDFVYPLPAGAVNSLGEITQIKKTFGQTKWDQCGDKGRSLRISENRMHCNIQFTWWPEKWSVSVSHCDKTQNATLVWTVCFMISPTSKTCKRQREEVNHEIKNIFNNYSTYIKKFYASLWNTLGELENGAVSLRMHWGCSVPCIRYYRREHCWLSTATRKIQWF